MVFKTKGGITTLEEKSLGCVKKAGTSEIVDVLDYGELVKEVGVSALNARCITNDDFHIF